MEERSFAFKVSLLEFEYLKRVISDQSLVCRFNSVVSAPGRKVTILLSRNEAATLRNQLIDRLPEVGFDRNDCPNEEGLLLEDLIDRLFLR